MMGLPKGGPIAKFMEVDCVIRNLNQLSFKGYGTIFPERAPGIAAGDTTGGCTELTLTSHDAAIYRAVSEVWLYSSSTGMTVLSVSADKKSFQHYYLDKPVCIAPGIYFCLSPFRQDCSKASLAAVTMPEITGEYHQVNDFQLTHRLWVTDLYTFFYHEKERGFFFPGESHPMLELTYVDQGSMHSVADGQEMILEQGELVIYGPNQWHMQYADMNVAPRYVTISFDLVGSDLHTLLGRKFKIPQSGITILQQLLREQERMDDYSTDMIIALLTQLLLILSRSVQTSAPKLRASNALHSENEIIRRAQQYISTHIREKLSVPLVAKNVDVSPSYLTALFHKNLQISPGEYIRRIKLQESKQMIRENSMNFTEIAATLQYSTVHHFSRQFKEKFGITPSEYAKSVR